MIKEVKLSIPGFLPNPTEGKREKIDGMLSKFGNARRRAYNMIRKGIGKSEIERRLQRETGLNARYVKDAIHSIKDLPTNVTFGGKKNQELREKGKISKEEFHRRRNCVLTSRGEKSKKGNLNLRVIDDGSLKLRINIGNREWIHPDLFVPRKYLKKYGHLLNGSRPYQVTIIREGGYSREYEVKITVRTEGRLEEMERIMALDVNSGHIDWAVVDKDGKRLVETGRIDRHQVLDAPSGKTENLLHELVNKIKNIAKHYNAEVVAGNLNSGKFSSNPKANRKVKQMAQYKLRRILSYKLPFNGIPYGERSEAYTTVLGQYLCKPLGLDVHKASAFAFAIKILDCEEFQTLRRVLADDGDGIQSDGLSEGCDPTGLVQSYASGNWVLSGLDDDDLEAMSSSKAIPRQPGRGNPIGLKGPSRADVKAC